MATASLPAPVGSQGTGGAPSGLRSLPPWSPWAGGLALGVLIFGMGLIARFVHYTAQDLRIKQRMIAASEAARLEEQRRAVAALLERDPSAWRAVLQQVVADALGEPGIRLAETAGRITEEPLAMWVVGSDGRSYALTPEPRAFRGSRRVALRGLSEEVRGVWDGVADSWMGGTAPSVPRNASWFLVVMQKRWERAAGLSSDGVRGR